MVNIFLRCSTLFPLKMYPKGKIKSYQLLLQAYAIGEINQNRGNVPIIMSPGLAIFELISL